MIPDLGKSMTRFRLRPCPRGFVVIECPYLMGEHMCQKPEIARDQVYYLEITWDKVRDAFPTPTLGITTLVRDPRSNLFKVPSLGPRLWTLWCMYMRCAGGPALQTVRAGTHLTRDQKRSALPAAAFFAVSSARRAANGRPGWTLRLQQVGGDVEL